MQKKHGKVVVLGIALLLITGVALAGAAVEDDGFEAAKPQLEAQLRMEVENKAIMSHLDQLWADTDVSTHLDTVEPDDLTAVIATVDGHQILQMELTQIERQEMQQMMMMGMDPNSPEAMQLLAEIRPMILDNLIYNKLLELAVIAAGLEAEESAVEEYYQEIAQQFGGEESLQQQLVAAGMTKDELLDNISMQLIIEAYLDEWVAANVSEDDLVFTEEQLRQAYALQQQQMQDFQLQMPTE